MRLADEVAARDAAVFVGRERELAVLEGLLDPASAHRVAFVAGPPGVGKSALLRELRRRSDHGGRGERLVAVEASTAAVAELVADETTGAEAGAGTVLVVELRDRPDPAWWTSPWASSAMALTLDPLPASEAARLLAAHGITEPEEVAHLVRWADGLPLALTMAAAARGGRGGALEQDVLARLEREVLIHLTDGLLADAGLLTVDRMVLAVAALAPAVDAALLASVLPELGSGPEAERWVRSLSFSEPSGVRVALQSRVRRLLVAGLRDDDPELERMLRVRIIDHLADVAGRGRPDVVVDIREVLALPVDRGVAPSMAQASGWRVETGQPADADPVGRLLEDAADPEHVSWVQRWLREAPEHVVVARHSERPEPAAVAVWVTPGTVPGPFRGDPRLGGWLDWLSGTEPSGNALLNPVTEVFVTGPAADEVGPLVLHALAQRCGLPNFRLWLTTCRPGAPDPRHCDGIRTPALDLELGATTVEGWVLDYGHEGVIPSLRARAHAELDRSTAGGVGPGAGLATYDAVREALRCCHDPVALARSPLARGDEPAERAAYVAELLSDAVEHAFGSGPGAERHREVLRRGYLDPDADHSRAMRALHLSRTTYFRRLREATAQLTAWLEASPHPAPRPTAGQRTET